MYHPVSKVIVGHFEICRHYVVKHFMNLQSVNYIALGKEILFASRVQMKHVKSEITLILGEKNMLIRKLDILGKHALNSQSNSWGSLPLWQLLSWRVCSATVALVNLSDTVEMGCFSFISHTQIFITSCNSRQPDCCLLLDTESTEVQ